MLPFFSFLNNGIYLLFRIVLPHQGSVEIVGLIGSDFRADEFTLDKVPGNDLQRLTVFLIHGEEEQREHDDNHSHGRKAQVASASEQEKGRDTNQRRRPEADELPFCQAKEYLCLYSGQVSWYGNIRSHVLNLLPGGMVSAAVNSAIRADSVGG